MGVESSFSISGLMLALAAAYLLGALPFAHLAARLRGVDVFSTGSTLAGTANVFWNVGRRTGALVFVGDVAKGAAAIWVARLLEVPPQLLPVAGGAAIAGHWKSVFSGFRGGDGMAPLMGASLALVPALALPSAALGFATVLLLRKNSLRSTWGVIACFAAMLGLSQLYELERDLTGGLAVLAALVLLRSAFARRRRAPAYRRLDEDLAEEDEEESDMELDPPPLPGAAGDRR